MRVQNLPVLTARRSGLSSSLTAVLSAVGAAILLTACAAGDMSPPETAAAPSAQTRARAKPPRPTTPKPAQTQPAPSTSSPSTSSPPSTSPPSTSPSAAQPAQHPPVPAPEAYHPDKLKGLDETQALAMLGEPTKRAERPPARLWTYDIPSCRLELAFYLDVSGSGFRVLSYNLKPQGKDPAAGSACLEKIRNPRR